YGSVQRAQVGEAPEPKAEEKPEWKYGEALRRLRSAERLLDALIEVLDVSGFGEVWRSLDWELCVAPEFTIPKLVTTLKGLKPSLNDKHQVSKSLVLRNYYARGERLLKEMEADLERKDRAGVQKRWESLEAHLVRMIAIDADYQKAVNDLRYRGEKLKAQADSGN
ncbi:hypothetical protein ACFL59_14085, partial [Planctomycetota bacterium]